MRFKNHRRCACILASLALIALAYSVNARGEEAPLEIWPRQTPAVDKKTLHSRNDAIDSAASSLPLSLAPAVQFEKLFLRIMSGEAPSSWRGEIEKFASAAEQSPLETGLKNVARAWLARAEMADINIVLRNYYRHHVRFPFTFQEVEADIPENLRKDPWGDAWFYQPRAPWGFEGLTGQRYQLGPSRYPQLGVLADATRDRAAAGPAWQITPQDVAGNKALEFHSTRAAASVAVLQPGGRVDDCTLLFIGDRWALMAGIDQLFAVSF
jgi:hypothetical protein